MIPTKLVAVLALLTVSASGLSGYNPSAKHAPRRHSSRAVGARAARGLEREMLQSEVKRDVVAPRKRGIKARRCAVKTSSALPSSTPVPETSTDDETSTSEPAPEPTTSSASPTTTKTKAAAPTSYAPPATKTSSTIKETPTPDSGSSGSSGGSHTGQATYYATGLGACGITNNDSDMIAAASMLLFDGFEGYKGGDPNSNPICNRKVKANYKGKSVFVTITDRCVGCAMGDLDFSPTAFNKLADPSLGRLDGMTWDWA